MRKLLTIMLFISITISAQELNKVYFLSEGGMSAGSSNLSLLELPEQTFNKNIFDGGDIGLYADGLASYQNYLYLTAQGNFGGSGKIYKLDTTGAVMNSKVFGTNPYAITISNDKAYVTNGPASSVSVLKLNDFSLVTEVTVGVYPQEIISHEGKIFVANTGRYNGPSDSTVSVIDSETDEIVETIKVRKDPSALAITNEGRLLIGCPGDEKQGIIYRVNVENFSKADSFSVPGYGFGKDIAVDENSEKIYFKGSENQIVELDLSNGSVTEAVNDENLIYTYGYNYDYTNNRHYVLDAKDFSSDGSLRIYTADGELEETYQTSIAPRRVMFKYKETTTKVNDKKIAENYALKQNYPNPFNPSTTIAFNLPKQTSVKLSVYNSLGEKVTELLNKQLQAGQHKVEFHASDLSSGIYYYKINTGEFISARKMMLIK